jgi:hypothetical protein
MMHGQKSIKKVFEVFKGDNREKSKSDSNHIAFRYDLQKLRTETAV